MKIEFGGSDLCVSGLLAAWWKEREVQENGDGGRPLCVRVS